MLSAILWQNAAQTVTLFDLPTSISLAQGTPGRNVERRLLSSEPLREPFPSNEPGSLSAEVKSSQNTVADDLHAKFKPLIAEALQQISNAHMGDWCLPRAILPKEAFRTVDDLSSTGEETVSDILGQASSSISDPNFHAYVQNLSYLSSFASPPRQICLSSLVSTGNARLEDLSDIWNSVLSNDVDRMTIIEIPFQTSIYTFCIPPNSSFVFSRLRGSCLQDSVYNETSGSRVEFDFILMDPPWPNASAKRRRSYDGPATVRGIKDLLSSIPVKDLLAQAGLLGVWVTNKQTLRDVILGRKGMFNVWGIELVEEWIWLKTTIKGEPIIDIDSSWRKPYEVLLIGRRIIDKKSEQLVKRRVIVSVPDLHSRKPCLRGWWTLSLWRPLTL